jgi:hypothetical protein
MPAVEQLDGEILRIFGGLAYPGDRLLHSLWMARDAEEQTSAFRGKTDWRLLDAAFLDAHYDVWSFFSEAALRYYLPALLRADVRGELRTADPVFTLTHGFSDSAFEHRAGGEVFTRRFGASVLIHPDRYGAMRAVDLSRFRLSVFAREEAAVIVAYLNFRKARSEDAGVDGREIDRALESFWIPRSHEAPTQAELAAHTAGEARFAAAIRRDLDAGKPS